jgi:hypothetical protein
MPFVTQVTFVRSGVLAVRIKGPQDSHPNLLRLKPAQAVLTEPGVFFQLINDGTHPCEVLYIVSPAYTFEMTAEGDVVYDDSLVLAEDWDALAASDWLLAQPMHPLAERDAATQRLALRKGKHP